MITELQLRAFLPTLTTPGAWVSAINPACDRFEITAPVRLAAFLAQVAHESGLFLHLEENLSYSAERLQAVWSHRFPTVASAEPYAHQPVKLANYVYANRLGNGDVGSGDGWMYRGRGLIQLTGRNNYRLTGQAIGLTLESDPDQLKHPTAAALSAAQYWSMRGLNRLADLGTPEDFDEISRRINGGYAGQAERRALWIRAKEALA